MLSFFYIHGISLVMIFVELLNLFLKHKGVNSTSLALIPKVTSPSKMQEFQPISLCTVTYKCSAKIMASRLTLVLPFVVDQAQSAFIPGCQISDNVLLAQKLFHGYRHESGVPKCAIKSTCVKLLIRFNGTFF